MRAVAADSKGVVAVTGASGYIGSFVVSALLDAGYFVRACVRDPSNAEKVGHLRKEGVCLNKESFIILFLFLFFVFCCFLFFFPVSLHRSRAFQGGSF